ncbi:collagen-binding protein [Yeosuana aromativorans]|uniref:Collagen-binding protein n=1 Tax=Yeosuana aromativorans TaxID=288019 RepID=A0A8J3BGY7_9FLAO|nr:TonB-dependent receptor [Yeosuana aromativorans]GGK13467.1 collagen-binding protein [Yeosuana aromativorans]
MKKIILLFILFVSTFSYAQTTGSIVGKLIDKEYNNEPLAFANILIKGTTKGTTSDIDGLYGFENLTPGTYTLVFSFVGYETQEINAQVVAGKVTEINVPMGASAASLDEVVITTTTKRESETALLLEQKKAVEIKQSIGAEELSRKGVSDAAGAVSKISGISKQEGSSNVYVRGLGDRYLNTTLNGLSLPSNNVNKKNIDLNLFSTDIIENVSVSKAYSSKFYGDFSAGNVDIKSKDYTGNGFLELTAGSGFNTNAIGKNFVRSEGTGFFGYYGRYAHNPFAIILSHGIDPVDAGTPININYGGSAGKSFNFKNDSKLSLFLTGSFENGYEYRKGSAVDYTLTEKKAFDAAEEYEYSTNSTVMGSAIYRIDDKNKLKFTSLFINNSSDVVGYFGIDGTGRSRDAQQDTQKGFYQMNVQFDQTQMTINQLEGSHTSGKFDVDWGVGYNLVHSKQPDRKRITLENYQYALDNDPNTNPTFYNNVDYDNQRYFQNITDEEINSRLNLAYNLSDQVKINFGYDGKHKTRDFNNIRYGYQIVDTKYPVTDVTNFNDIFSLDNLRINPNDNTGIYQIKVFNPIPGLNNVNRPGLPENTYKGVLNVYAGYANAEIKAGDKWLFVPGIRFENIEQNISYDVINLGNKGVDAVNTTSTIFLPSLNIKYAINDDQNLRFTASQTVSLPEFKEAAPFVYENVSSSIGGNPDILGATGANLVNINNTAYSKIYNIDLKYEWFFSKSELLSISAFTKQIKDPINLVVGADATGTQRYFRTGDKANIYGVELEIRKNLITTDDDDAKLSIGFNGTYMKTTQNLYDQIVGTRFNLSFNKSKDKLQGASPFLLNADIQYAPVFNNYKPTGTLVFSYFADRIDALGSGDLGNIVEKGVPTLDFVWKNNLLKNKLEINLSAKNLLNPTIKYVRQATIGDVVVTSANGKGISNYKRGMDVGLQLKYKF